MIEITSRSQDDCCTLQSEFNATQSVVKCITWLISDKYFLALNCSSSYRLLFLSHGVQKVLKHWFWDLDWSITRINEANLAEIRWSSHILAIISNTIHNNTPATIFNSNICVKPYTISTIFNLIVIYLSKTNLGLLICIQWIFKVYTHNSIADYSLFPKCIHETLAWMRWSKTNNTIGFKFTLDWVDNSKFKTFVHT